MSLKIIVGCMFSGKTSELIKEVKRLTVIDKKILLINSNLDTRYDNNKVCSHNQEKIECISVKNLQDIDMIKYTESEYIIIDEAQFYEDLFDFVTVATDLNNKHVIIVGLNGDFDRNNFGEIHKLYPYADNIVLLKAMCLSCKDGTEAIFSKKIVNDKKQTDIGNQDKYMPVCRKCYLN